MRIYTIHIPTRGPGAFASRPNSHFGPDLDAVVVKEGFCWPAFFLSFIWALWHRLWWVALGLAALQVGVGGAVGLLAPNPVIEAAVSIGLAALVGGFANDLRRWTLARRGYGERAVIAAEDREAALARYLDRRSPGLARAAA